MFQQTHQSTRTGSLLRREASRLRGDIDRFAHSFASWTANSVLREKQAEVRFHVIEAQLARLSGSGTMETPRTSPDAPQRCVEPVVFPIAAYRTR